MAVTNINTLQKLAYTGTSKDLQTASDIYLKQSLSNLGQRFSIKGDGVSVGEFALYELFDNLPIPTEENIKDKLYNAYMVGTVEKVDDDVEIHLSACGIGGEDRSDILLSINNYAEPNTIYKNGTKVTAYNGVSIAYYNNGGIITKSIDSSYYNVAFKTSDSSYNDINITVDRYDSYNNCLLDGIHIYEKSNVHLMTVISSVDDNIYNIKHYYTGNDMSTIYNNYIVSKDGPVKSNKRDWVPADVANAILDKTLIAECDVKYTEGSIVNIDIDDITFYTDYSIVSTKQECFDFINGNIREWNNSVSLMLSEFVLEYNKIFINSDDSNSLKKHIVASIFYALYENYTKSTDNINIVDSVFNIYMPYEYSFIYTYNSNEPAQIFASNKDVTVEATLEPESDIYKIYRDRRDQLIICSAWSDTDSTDDIYSLWKYYVIYDSLDTIKDVIVEQNFTMPYINSDGYWNVNNVDTSIYARGKDGGQPSLIISYSDTFTGKHEILSTMKKDELSTALLWDYAYFNIKPLNSSSVTSESLYHRMATYMPSNIDTSYYHENLVTFLENAIIMSITSVHSEIPGIIDPLSYDTQLGPNATVTTFWALKRDEDGKYNFTYVKQPDSAYWAVDFNYLADSEAIIKYYMQLGMEPDKYKHSWLVFDGVTNSIKQSGDILHYAYPVIRNENSKQFIDMLGNIETTGTEYSNNANIVPSFTDHITMSGSYIADVPDNAYDKFFHFETGSYNYVDVVQAVKDTSQTTYIMANEWYPNASINNFLPILDLKEVFTRNINALNRYNILSTAENGQMYYGYIGTSHDIADKSIFRIGSGTTNINLGLKTLTEESERSKFAKQNEINIDFDNIVLNGDVVTPKHIWNSYIYTNSDGKKYTEYSTIYNMTYTGSSIPGNCTYTDAITNRQMFFTQSRTISNFHKINNIYDVQGKTIPVTFLNIREFVHQNLGWYIGADTNVNVIANKDKLYTFYDGNIPYHFLELSTDITDKSCEVVDTTYMDNKAYILRMNPLSISYTFEKNNTYDVYNINIREITTAQSTTYAMYDGGELNG